MSLVKNYLEVAISPEHGLSVFECLRSKVLPALKVRRACIEDHDDLVPVVERAARRNPALAQLPGIGHPPISSSILFSARVCLLVGSSVYD